MKHFKYQDFIDELADGNLYGVFVDDTGSPGLSTTPEHLHKERKTWVGVIVPPNQIKEVLQQFPRALEELEKATGATEFHFTDIYSGKKGFAKHKVDLPTRLGLFNFMAYIFTSYRFPVFVQTLDPETLSEFLARGNVPDQVGPFRMSRPNDVALFLLLLRVKWYLEKAGKSSKARVFIDEGYKKNENALRMPSWQAVFCDGLLCFARSSSIHPIQLADFAAFCLNRTQLLLGKQKLSDLDKELLRILSPMAWNYQNIDKRIVEMSRWDQTFKLPQTQGPIN
ncbi:MAG TPA: DUF3800 domain-containing protein [Pyrinomonadaceae bacterium]|nr:DUF3800 domain-containing protein [Pyrinomonadaceae bacterium]